MTTTMRAQDDLRIVQTGPPAIEQAQLMVQLMQLGAVSGADEGYRILHSFEKPPTLAQLRRRHEPGTSEYAQVMSFLTQCEAVGTFVKNSILDGALVHDMWAVAGAWTRCEKVCKGLRKESGEPRLFENFEMLASQSP